MSMRVRTLEGLLCEVSMDMSAYFLRRWPTAAERAQLEAAGYDPDEGCLTYGDRDTGLAVAWIDRCSAEALQVLFGGEVEEVTLIEALRRAQPEDQPLLVRGGGRQFVIRLLGGYESPVL